MKTISLRPADLERDFGQLAALFSLEQDEPTSAPELKVDYEVHKERIFRHNTKNLPMIAIDRKLGYVQMPGTFLMEKNLATDN